MTHHCNYVIQLVLNWSVRYEATKLVGAFMVFQEAMSELAGKAKKPTACHLMPHNKHLGIQGRNCQFHNHKDIQPLQVLDSHDSTFSSHVQCLFIFIASFYTVHQLFDFHSFLFGLSSSCVFRIFSVRLFLPLQSQTSALSFICSVLFLWATTLPHRCM